MVKIKSKEGKKKKLPPSEIKNVDDSVALPPVRNSDDPTPKQVKWINRQRVLVFAARGINHRHRHLMEDIKKLMPHHKTESKMERSKNLYVVNEISEMKNCNKCILFEGRKMRDLYLWMSNVPNGPSVKFLVENIYTMGELKMTGNCLRGSRPLLSFDPQFTKDPHYTVLKELLTQTFGVPYYHPKSQPFFDHVYTFMILDNRIWFRNYQILSEDGALAEIGPRFVLNPVSVKLVMLSAYISCELLERTRHGKSKSSSVYSQTACRYYKNLVATLPPQVKIFSGSFGGVTLWENPKYISPAKLRQAFSKKAANKYERRVEKKAVYEATKPETGYPDIEGADFFKGDPLVKAQEVLVKDEPMEDDEENVAPVKKPVFSTKKSKSRPDMAIRRKQLKAKSKAISDQIKKRKLLKKRKP